MFKRSDLLVGLAVAILLIVSASMWFGGYAPLGETGLPGLSAGAVAGLLIAAAALWKH